MRIAILDDEKTQLQLVEYALIGGDNDWGEVVECVCFDRGEALLESLKNHQHYDCLIMDRQLPDMSGDVILQWLRQYGQTYTPVIMVSNLRSEDEVANTITSGADDYLAKPFRPKELVARVKRLRARQAALSGQVSAASVPSPPVVLTSNLDFDTLQDVELHGYRFSRGSHVVRWADGQTRLTEREFSLALYLFSHVGTPLARDDIFQAVWKRGDVSNGRVLTAFMYRVRTLLNLNQGNTLVLRPVYGYGYRLDRHT